MTDTWIPKRAANRQMPLREAYIKIEQQRDLLIIFINSSALLTQWQKSLIQHEVNNMAVWLADHKLEMDEIYK